ncbi:hypothetical protein CANARDRAFT_22576 [[Candida] arabinofermentans NRRL YB-2248]|uniref:Uncharacterized protein n=1 Tax=[Candida] arabinofermentans NRRL YB-2248 TaxID=983967 RepID=A0A1E4T223_9ASCO|nr:hypothetical protein CANARDRAFT_22576 [[Candida] arabinofermentans NRRL YB-2248]
MLTNKLPYFLTALASMALSVRATANVEYYYDDEFFSNQNIAPLVDDPVFQDLPVFYKSDPPQQDPGNTPTTPETTFVRPTSINSPKDSYDFISYFWNEASYPNDIAQAATINSTLFSNDCKGRVSLTRNFEDDELNTEYIFGLFSRVKEVDFSMIGYPTEFLITEFNANDSGFFASSVILNFTFPQLNNFTIPIQVDLWAKLIIEDGLVKMNEYDAIFRNFAWAYDEVLSVSGAALVSLAANTTYANYTGDELIKLNAVKSICDVATQYCNGTNLQYDSYEDCVTYLSTEVRLGEGWEGGMDTIFCRNLHQAMVPYRPTVHCPHIGPSGGDMCRDSDMNYWDVVWRYSSYFDNMVYT